MAHAGFFRLLMKVIFDPYILWPYDPKNDFLISNTCWNLFIKNKYQIPTEFLNNYWSQLLDKQPSTKFSFSIARKRCHRHFFLRVLRISPPILNPKRCGLFGQLRRRGGSKMTLWEIVVSGSSNFDTDLTDSVSYESWHPQLKFETSLRSLRLILWPQEVSEVTEVKMKKIWGEIPRIANFWLTEM